MNIFSWVLNAILIENVILSRFLGTCPFVGVSKDKKNALGMGLAVVIVMTLSSLLSWIIYNFLLLKLNLVYMKTIIFILVIASFVQMLEMIMKKITPTLYKSVGIYLPLITTNCAVLGIATIVSNYSFLKSLVVSFASGLGFMFVIYIFSTIREKIDNNNIPKNFKGIPIAFITASIMAMIILRFSGV